MRTPTPLDALTAHRNTVIRANSYEVTLREAVERNKAIIERLEGEIERAGGKVEEFSDASIRRRDAVETEFKPHGRADW